MVLGSDDIIIGDPSCPGCALFGIGIAGIAFKCVYQPTVRNANDKHKICTTIHSADAQGMVCPPLPERADVSSVISAGGAIVGPRVE